MYKVIGDYRGLSRALAICKTIAAYNMVYVHGSTLLAGSILILNMQNYRWLPLAMFRGLSSICLPAFAGYYVRAELGPELSMGRVSKRHLKRAADFFMLAIALEALRLVTTTLNPSFSLSWQALHFIALSMFVTYAILSFSPRLLPLFFILVLALRWPLELVLTPPRPDLSNLVVHELLAWIWRGVLCAGVVFVVYRATQAKLWVGLLIGVLLASLLLFFKIPNERGLLSFAALPFSIWLPNAADDNYWSFFVCFPVFMFGYFARAFLFDLKYRRWWPLLNLVSAVLAIRFFMFGFTSLERLIPERASFSKLSFAMPTLDILGLCAVNYFIFLAIYYFMRNRELGRAAVLVQASRSVLMLYLVHEIIFVGLRFVFPFHWLDAKSETVNLVVILILIHAGYFISLALSNFLVGFIERRQNREVFT